MRRLIAFVVTALIFVTANAALAAGTPTPRGKPFTALQSQIDTLLASVTNLDQRVTLTEQNIVSLQQTAADLQAQIDANTGDISALETQLTATNQMIYKLTTELNQTKAVLAKKQNIVNGICPSGEYVAAINSDGSLVCRADVGANGLVRYTVSNALWLQQCTIFNPNCSSQGPSGTLVVTCPNGTLVTGGGYSTGPWVGVWSAGVQGNSYVVSGGLAPIAMFGGGVLTAEAQCIGLR